MDKEGDIVLEIYKKENGQEPFTEWIESVKDSVLKARIKSRIRRVEIGNFGNCKAIGSGLFELKLDFGPGYRVYFGKKNNVIVLLLCGGDKKSQKRDIKVAIEYWGEQNNRK
jgi:putative addiction module killer protein